MMANMDQTAARALFRRKILRLLSIGFFGFVILSIFSPVIPLLPGDLDTKAIEQTVQLSQELQQVAECTLDDSRMGEVYANDIRGRYKDWHDVQLVRTMTGRQDFPRWQIGSLDVKQAWFAYRRRVKQLYDEAIATGAYPTGVYPDQIPEIKALGQAVGGRSINVLPRANCIYSIAEHDFPILSVRVNLLRNFAYATINFQHFTSRLVFVKEDGLWKIAGGKVVRWHKG